MVLRPELPEAERASREPRRAAQAGRGRFPAALVCVLAFALCEKAVWNYGPWLEFCARYAPPKHACDPLRTEAWIRMLKPEAEPPILFVGSSQILNGLECAPFHDRWPNRTCRNLAVVGGTPLDTLFLTDRIDRRVTRRVLVTSVSPNTLHLAPKAAFCNTRTLACLARGGAFRGMSPSDWLTVVNGELQNLSESLRMKDALPVMWEIVRANPSAALRFQLPPAPLLIRDGARPGDVERTLQRLRTDPSLAPGRFTGANEAALDALVEQERGRGNLLVILDMPTGSGYESAIRPDALEHYQRLSARLAKQPGVVFVPRSSLPTLEDDEFYDFSHVTASGALKLSERVAAILAELEQAREQGPALPKG